MAEPTQLVVSCLMASEKPQTAQEIQKATRLPLPIVTRLLQNLANESLPSVERLEENGQIVYRFIGLAADAEKKVANASSSAPRPATPARKPSLKAVPQAKKPAKVETKKAEPEKKAEPAKKTKAAGEAKPVKPAVKAEAAPAKPAEPATTKAVVSTPRPSLKVVPQKKSAATSNGPDYRAIYRQIAEHLGVPHNISRLANATGLDKGHLQIALDTLVDAKMVVRREVPEFQDVIYRAAGDLAATISAAPLPAGVAESAETVETAVEVEEDISIVELQACMAELKARLSDEAVALSALGHAEKLVDELRAQVKMVTGLREAAQAAVEQFEALIHAKQG